ncbi:isopeptide-forming domain-containing fimbrial protein [Ruminococcus flavefaciens]|uniref:LPXTG-motif cell wall anchor domain-containing protein/fimbrial isopeptide formation D2 domain-containing protein n=1 Tax=Ruminococcus flavefaciens TaxID=1265 RepID=A0A1M7M6H5_RUMFL|nr:isopeptide-forming domain-containing fimbrial protein [Ruminococcus flavefaciens]SHM86314.1 LPXTG-motif cell wall anchor domain-containing protein/fimbrial isopeptide formation D2 domain-containing protein [Ruminococcus flavefaciens]
MKNNKRFLALMTAGFLAITPMAATCMTAVAAGTSTLTVTDSDTVAHDYNAYQIITGTESGGKLTGLAWGNGINSASLISALTDSANAAALGITASEVGSTPESVAAVLSKITDGDKLQKLAKIIASCKDSTNAIDLVKSGTSYSASSLEHGWYLVLDESTLGNGNTDVKVRSANILKFTGDTTINSKHSLPTLDKQIVSPNPNTAKDANSASIGETITYSINLKVPDTTGYNKFFYVVEDTLSPGLDYIGTTSVVVDGHELTVDDDPTSSDSGKYYVNPGTYNSSTGTTIKYVFEDFLNYIKNTAGVEVGDDIVITYTAKLNENAVLTDAGNPNDAKLIYSNDPNHEYTGTPGTTPDEPSSSEPKGETPNDEVITFTTEVQIKKVDQDGKPLTGVGFTLKGSPVYQVLKSGVTFTADNDGTYYKLKTGAYTLNLPTTETSDKYESTTQKYKKTVNSGTLETASGSGTEKSVTATVDANGYISFKGLGAGEYTLVESTTPEGYNTISPISFTIGNGSSLATNNPNWTITPATFIRIDDENTYEVEIENRQGATLPTTGGIGTKLFYIIGGLLVAGSVVLLVTKKRMSTKED